MLPALRLCALSVNLTSVKLPQALTCVGGVMSNCVQHHFIHSSTICLKKQAGKYRKSIKGDKPLTYEMSLTPPRIGHMKSWNSWNTSNLLGGLRSSETAIEDEFIRRFVTGTWHNVFVSEVILKRQHNMIRIAGIIQRTLLPRKMYFLIGYTEELLSYWLQCPVKLELQTVGSRKDVTFKYI